MNKITLRVLIVSAVLLFFFGMQVWLTATPVAPKRARLADFPAALGNWSMRTNDSLPDDVLAVLKPDDYLQRSYKSSTGPELGVFIAYYAAQRAGESMHSPKNCLPGSGWEPIERSTIVIGRDSAGNPLEANYFVVQKGTTRAAVIYWYQESGRVIASEYWGKAFLVWDGVKTGRHDGAIIRLVVPVEHDESPNHAVKAAVAFAQELRPVLPKFLPN